ncbi:MAG: hypothetical protein LC115_10110 [Bacteroidia bacterium]|nr:hypothetical protein [Bacteroidia bacterium]
MLSRNMRFAIHQFTPETIIQRGAMIYAVELGLCFRKYDEVFGHKD